ncbi:hypothetical protein ACLN6N_02590 [Sphingomonas carotinifaciens]|uniref:hypothetical protein n=1 Tax=Sphingomonas carotinifaciens TaxID=1166323 RepID=UPI0039A17498
MMHAERQASRPVVATHSGPSKAGTSGIAIFPYTVVASSHRSHGARRVIFLLGITAASFGAMTIDWRSSMDTDAPREEVVVVRVPDRGLTPVASISPQQLRTAVPTKRLADLSLIERQLLVRGSEADHGQSKRLGKALAAQLATISRSISLTSVIATQSVCEVSGLLSLQASDDQGVLVEWLTKGGLTPALLRAGLRDLTEISINRENNNMLTFVIHGRCH